MIKVIKVGRNYYRINVLHSLTLQYFTHFIVDEADDLSVYNLPSVDKTKLEEEKKRLGYYSYAEYSLLFEAIVNQVLAFNQFFFHGAAFIWQESAYIFTGKSGIGKTTQLAQWMNLFHDEIEIINGDKPLIEIYDDKFIVFPSPWGGKEGFNGSKSAELKGIILLEQGNSDHISKLDVKDAVFPLFLQFLYSPDDLQSVNAVCEYEEKLLSTVPVYKLINRGTEQSAILTHSFLTKEVSDEISNP